MIRRMIFISDVLQVVKVSIEDFINPSDTGLGEAACKYVIWVIQNAKGDTLFAVAEAVLQGVMYALHVLAVAHPGALRLRGMLYQVVGHIAQVLL